ncbi:MAG: aminotransferase class I/II-fold pyridoxal phosphate-dependent enzyme, partial [Kiritimatiellia bacterium]
MNFYGRLNEGLEALRAQECLRTLPKVPSGLVNLSSNDYLGLLEEVELRESFYAQLQGDDRFLSASSRLLTGNTAAVCALERDLAHLYDAETSLVLGSGYHANTGIIPALAGSKTLILADKLIHASMIDGIRLSGCRYFRYRHNDLTHARQLLERYSTEF